MVSSYGKYEDYYGYWWRGVKGFGNYHADPVVFNPRLTEWLVEYNAVRPHQALGYRTPLRFAEEQQHLSMMWSSSTDS